MIIRERGSQKKAARLERRAAFLLRIVVTIPLVFYYLSKIIIHNITPSASYDATSPRRIARNIFGRVVPEVGLEPTWALSPPDFESGAYTNFATPAEVSMIRIAVGEVKNRTSPSG